MSLSILFFFKQKTAYEMRISDWSSDVCSSDLDGDFRGSLGEAAGNYIVLDLGEGRYATYEHLKPGLLVEPGDRVEKGEVIAAPGMTGQATGPDRQSAVTGKSVSVRVELGGRRIINNKTITFKYSTNGQT